jgi:ZIP family zinc transporter
VLAALLWGLAAASSLVLGAVIGVVRPWPDRLVGAIMAFGAGALISAVSFDLALGGVREAGGLTPVAIGLAVGALVFFVGDSAVDRMAERRGANAQTAAVAANVPEAMGSAAELFKAGARASKVVLGWLAVAVTTALAAPLGFRVADALGGEYIGVVNGFAAGALLVMLASSMVPESREKAGLPAGVITVLGFALAFALSKPG